MGVSLHREIPEVTLTGTERILDTAERVSGVLNRVTKKTLSGFACAAKGFRRRVMRKKAPKKIMGFKSVVHASACAAKVLRRRVMRKKAPKKVTSSKNRLCVPVARPRRTAEAQA